MLHVACAQAAQVLSTVPRCVCMWMDPWHGGEHGKHGWHWQGPSAGLHQGSGEWKGRGIHCVEPGFPEPFPSQPQHLQAARPVQAGVGAKCSERLHGSMTPAPQPVSSEYVSVPQCSVCRSGATGGPLKWESGWMMNVYLPMLQGEGVRWGGRAGRRSRAHYCVHCTPSQQQFTYSMTSPSAPPLSDLTRRAKS